MISFFAESMIFEPAAKASLTVSRMILSAIAKKKTFELIKLRYIIYLCATAAICHSMIDTEQVIHSTEYELICTHAPSVASAPNRTILTPATRDSLI